MSSSAVPPEQPLVLREQLPLPRHYVAPRTPTEQRLAQIWRTALSMDRVGVEDRYNDLGGDSFLAMTIFNTIEEIFGVAIPMAVLAEAQTIAALAPKIDGVLLDGPPVDGRTQHRSF
jgi:acyl carrier protein